jgi:hypothetical protein
MYHSPNAPLNVSVSVHKSSFLENLDAHLSNLTDAKNESYVFLDANIDLLKLNNMQLSNDYMDINLCNVFVRGH